MLKTSHIIKKVGVIFFHKNIYEIYPKEWVDKCVNSMLNQSYRDLIFYEIDYGGDGLQLVEGSKFFSTEKINYADAMNFIISEAFNDGCDYVFNTNLDDYYSDKRIEKQLEYLEMGFDIVSSDFCYIDSNDIIIHYMNILKSGSIKNCLSMDINVIAHPVVGISRKFWMDENNRYDITKTPSEDLDLWKRSIENYKFYILEDILLFYRRHDYQVSVKK